MTEQVCSKWQWCWEEKEDEKMESALVMKIRFHGKFKECPKIEGCIRTIILILMHTID